MNVLRDLGLIVGELLRDVACAMLCAALVLYVIALYSGGVFQTELSHAEACPNAALRAGPSAALPDCRAYEQVSPVEKNGGYINEGSFTSSPEGESVSFTSISGFAGATSGLYTQTGYQSSRESSGWVTRAQTQSEAQFLDYHSISPPDYFDQTFGNFETVRDGDLGLEAGLRWWLLQGASQPESDLAFYVTGLPDSDGGNVEVGPAVPPTASGLAQSMRGHEASLNFTVKGVSADGSHMVFVDPEPEGPNQWSFGGPGALLEYSGIDKTEPIPVVPHPATEDNGCSSQLLGGVTATANFNKVTNPISSNGSRIFFTSNGAEPECQGPGELFAHVETAGEGAHTVAISEPTKEDCAACEIFEPVPGQPEFAQRPPARFIGASEDGSKVFFSTGQPLLDGTGGVYEYDFDAPSGERVALVAAGNAEVVQLSEDGSHVYLLSPDILSEEPSPGVRGRDRAGDAVESDAVAQLGQRNLYVFERDGRYPTGHIGFVATLLQASQGGSLGEPVELENDATPDGRFFVFVARAPLTRDDTGTAAQVFEYDSLTHTMIRVSVGQRGYNNNGNAYLTYPGGRYTEDLGQLDSNDAAIVGRFDESKPTYNPSGYADHLSVSADGSYVFFTSPIALTPQALNRAFVGINRETGGELAGFASNVYEYHAGEVSLISDGKDLSTHDESSQVHLLSTTLSGHDVFFETVDPLVPQDTDSNKDIYDARIDGGFPAPVQPVPCSGDACQGQLSSSPVLLSPGSEFQAGGNPTPAAPTPVPVAKAKPKVKPKAKKCKRGTTLKRGRCVKQKAKKSNRRAK